MNFDQPYNRHEFVNFLRQDFLPENDFVQEETPVAFPIQTQYCCDIVTKLGTCQSLDLVIYEIRHHSKSDARVGMSKEAFRLLANEFEDKALVIFVPEDNADNYRLSFIEITLHQDEDSSRVKKTYSNPRRYSYYLGKGIACYTPNKYLNAAGRVTSIEDLRNRFSVEVLTKEFYQELSDWYAWAIKIIRFPNNIDDKEDDDKFNNEGAIRLITRLIFVWFLKQRNLIPNELFDENYLREKLIKDFKPYQMDGLLHDRGEVKYYTAILQNLFFAMLNCPITSEGSEELSERHFRKLNEQGKPSRSDYDNNKLMRYESYFKDPQLFVNLANRTVPFLNGGLFDCLDEKDKGIYYDGFSDSERSLKSLYLPDFLFFIPKTDVDLSVWYNDKKKKKVTVRGIIRILKRYNFTIEENTPFDQEVSLDPELLGKVFENLLASYNPETQTTARKQTGSFYTPREIVQYMVDESLVAHLKRTVDEELAPQFRQLMQYTDDEVNLTDEQRKQIMQSLYNCKVLDPACGSGAFPMGMLQQMVHILSRIDPGNTQWREMMLDMAADKTSEVDRTASSEYLEIKADIIRSFDENVNRPDYARKLYLIENCIYGVDIQSIAIQISKLRFFISLIVDQKTNNNPADNFGIRPLPNLEAKFVAANTLIGLNKKDATLFDTEAIRAKKEELKIAKHKIFGAKTVQTKRKYRQIVNDLRLEIANMLEECGAVGNVEAQQLASWDMFDQNASSPFFDPEWMFDVKDEFDILIGNPPYIDAKEQLKKEGLRLQRETLSRDKRFKTLYQKWDLYIAFIEISIKYFCINNGICSMIIPYPISNQLYAKKLRKMITDDYDLLEVVDLFNVKVFENVTVTNCILFVRKSHSLDKTIISHADKNKTITHSYSKSIDSLIQDGNTYVWNFTLEDRNANRHSNMNVLGDFCYISVGMVLNADEKKAKGQFKKEDLISDVYDDIHCKKYIEGKDIERYNIKRTRFLEWGTKRSPNELRRATFEELYTNKKLLINALGQLKATIDINGEFYCEQQVRMALLWKDLSNIANKSITSSIKKFSKLKRCEMENLSLKVDILYLLGILNSRYSSILLADLRGGDYHIVPEHIRNIPIAPATKEQQFPIINLVNTILTAKSTDPNTDTSFEERKIDILVYHLYGLTYDEILIVDPQTPITRNEYEKE